jgi:phosphoesterase RecJ-like protein
MGSDPSAAPGASRAPVEQIRDELRRRDHFVITSHVRPDGDAIGSQLAMAYALRAMGKQVRVLDRDQAPPFLQPFPGVDTIEITDRVGDDAVGAVIVMECGDLSRTGLSGLEQHFIINIDHHPGNAGFGALNWFDKTAAACGEMVFDVIQALGVRLTVEMATHIYLAILTDTGSFHFSSISPRTFDISRQMLEAGVDPVWVARTVYDSNSLGRLKLFGAVLNAMQLEAEGRLAVLYIDDAMVQAAGGTYDDTEGLINFPLTVREIEAVAFFKQVTDAHQYRVSMRSKGDIDIGGVAKRFDGGGHKNAAGCTVQGPIETARGLIVPAMIEAIESGSRD